MIYLYLILAMLIIVASYYLEDALEEGSCPPKSHGPLFLSCDPSSDIWWLDKKIAEVREERRRLST
jgi:hypothetical protein